MNLVFWEDGVIRSRAVLVAIGINGEGRRCIPAVELAQRESQTSWKDFPLALCKRGLRGVEFVLSDDHPGLKRAIMEMLPGAVWQRCYVHFLRNALDHLPRTADDDCMMELRWIYNRRNVEEARHDLAVWPAKWGNKYRKLCDWVEANIEETLTFYRLPLQHHKHMKSTNMLERLNEEIKRRTRVIRIFPNEAFLSLVPPSWGHPDTTRSAGGAFIFSVHPEESRNAKKLTRRIPGGKLDWVEPKPAKAGRR